MVNRRLFALPCLAIALAATASCRPGAGSEPANVGAPRAAGSSTPAASASVAAPATPVRLTPAEIAARATPAVCSIKTARAMGTGFVVDRRGIIATNLHVVAGAPRITVSFADKREAEVIEIVAFSEPHDLALLRIDAGALPVLSLGESDGVRPGDAIVAIGHPLGLEDTVSNGLVSAVRAVDGDLVVLQISAPIAPGSSGGPIFDDHGDVIGVATAILRGGQNLAFGMPSRYVKELLRHPAPIDPITLAEHFARPGPQLPTPKRVIPHHPISALKGCAEPALRLVVETVGSAIDLGAPLYNDGNFAACYHIYEGAAQDLERRLPGACKGPIKALATGRAKAAGLSSSSDQAWAMRDAFDGVLDVIRRRAQGDTD